MRINNNNIEGEENKSRIYPFILQQIYKTGFRVSSYSSDHWSRKSVLYIKKRIRKTEK